MLLLTLASIIMIKIKIIIAFPRKCKKHTIFRYLNKTRIQWTRGSQMYLSSKNKTSIQWTPGSQLYISSKEIIFGQKLSLRKKINKCMNHTSFMPNHSCHKHYLHWFAAHYLIKASSEIAASSLKDTLRKGRKNDKKRHKLCIIMLINPSKIIS